ncbi:T-complex protein 1 subunit delta [Trifolium pratense]|uniref:T-complex protein 1 subunit delta n=1 Tax=Trifolium pratense TaxID=57577 RepID=A0A2K3N6I9_TRIPR|nr:T-complex protein 1 subunit delta [Trifolium pratense]
MVVKISPQHKIEASLLEVADLEEAEVEEETHEEEERGANGGRWLEGASNKRCKICKSNTHEEKDCWNKGKRQCHNCKRFGHIQEDCRFGNQQHASFAGENDEGKLFSACQKAFQEDKNVWYLDSGCSNHMTGKKEAFINIDSSFGLKVKLGNGEHVEVKGIGNIGVTSKQGSKIIHDTLYYVPELDENLLSIGQLLESRVQNFL